MRVFALFLSFVFAITLLLFPLWSKAQNTGSVASEKPMIVSTDKPGKTAPSAVEQAILDEINLARSEPQKYAKFLEDYGKLFKGTTVFLPNLLQVQTNEGVAPVDEAINFLKQLPKLEPYKFSDGLNQSSSLQLKDLMLDNSIGHKGKDGSTLTQRLLRFGNFGGIYAENISYYAEEARQIVLMMIVDDGLKSRSHRKNIFSPTFKVVGIAYGKGKVGEGLCVVDFADSFFTNNDKAKVRQF